VSSPDVEALVAVARRALSRLGVGAGSRVAVACSGGPDSVALADVSLRLRDAGALAHVTLVHVDHGLRPGAAADAALVERLAAARGAPFVLRAVAVAAEASLEGAARRARYAALDAAAAEAGWEAILLGHTAGDQAETILFRLLRGTGVAGLAGIPARRGLYRRPFLGVPRAAILAHVAAADLSIADDPMNRDPRFARSRIRHDLLPRLAAENPRLEAALGRLAADAADTRAVLDYAAAGLLAAARRDDGSLDVRRLGDAPAAVLRRALALAAAASLGQGLLGRHLDAVAALALAPAAGSRGLDLPGGRALRVYDSLAFVPRPTDRARPAEISAGEGTDSGLRRIVAAPDVAAGLALRRWQPGDRMRPHRLHGRSRKLSDLFVDARVPRALRTAALVLVDDSGTIVWAEHVGIAWGSRVSVSLTRAPDGATSALVTSKKSDE
jgi:tRNA(Ile)-lysidine synthase